MTSDGTQTGNDLTAASLTTADRGCCVYCGLPAGPGGSRELQTGAGDDYCCYGCRVAHAIVQEQGAVGAIRWTVVRLGLAIFFTMNLMAFTMTMWSLDVYDVQPDPFQQKLFEVFRWLSAVLGIPVLLLLGVPLLTAALQSWKQRIYSTDLLIATGVIAAYVTSMVNVVRNAGAIYFEVGAMVLVMVTLGRWFEAIGRHKATEALDQLAGLLPKEVLRITGNREESVEATSVNVGDLLRIRAGERCPTDAAIVRGTASIDEQMFSGESTPVVRSAGDPVLAGTVNLDGNLTVRATARLKEGSFGRLLNVLQEARRARGKYQQLADRAASWFFPVVTLVAVAAFGLHLPSGLGPAIQTSLAVLLIACPCALGLATPLAVWTALSTAVRQHVLFQSGEAIERLAAAKAIAFDKTGTLTSGTPKLTQMVTFGDADEAVAATVALQLSSASTHPFSRTVKTFLDRKYPDAATAQVSPLSHLQTVAGGGVELKHPDGRVSRLGSMEFVCCEFHAPDRRAPNDDTVLDRISRQCLASGSWKPRPHLTRAVSRGHNVEQSALCVLDGADSQPAASGADRFCARCSHSLPLGLRMQLDRLRLTADQQAASVVMVSVNRVPVVAFLLTEDVRAEAADTICQLAGSGLSVSVLTGDRAAKAHHLREALFPDSTAVPGVSGAVVDVRCNLRPEDKVAAILDIRSRRGATIMVGDGINDAPALAASDIGIAMGCGADVSRDSAQVCLLTNDLTRIPWAIDLARRTRSVIRQNLLWAFGYNSVGIVVAGCGMLNPAVAAGLMIASSLLVISNSMRLMRDDRSLQERERSEPGAAPPAGSDGAAGRNDGAAIAPQAGKSPAADVASFGKVQPAEMAATAGVSS